VLGISTQALVGTIALDLLHPDDLAVGQAYLSQITKLSFLRLVTPLRFRHADGSWHHLAIVLTNMVENPAVRGIVVNARDVTEQLALETQLRQSQKMEALGQLAGGVAHDFNNVLAAISGFARLVHDDLPIGSETRDDASEILAAAARGAGVTKQLLAFSRRQAMETQVIDLADVARETHRMLRPFLPAAVSLDVQAPDSRVPVRADRTQLEQVLINLALNACDAMPAGGVLTVHVGVQRDSDGPHAREVAQLIVRDGGVGMSDEVRARVFEPFFTTKESGRGTGLGLATVYGIVQQFGGSVTVDSAEGIGSTFTVELPLAHDTPSVIHARSDHAVPPSEGRTILLVEDEEQVRRSTTRILERAGYHVITAENGARALRLLTASSTAIHLVLTDAAMPELGGRELAQRVTELRPDVPVVLMSGYAELSGQDLRISGVDDAPEVAAFLEKPFSAERLLSLVEPLLSR
jgi:PAS domain S-box-containing protein